ETLDTVVVLDSFAGRLTGDSTAHGVRMYNDGDDEPFLEARQVVTDLSLRKGLGGARLPHRIDAVDAHPRLRFHRGRKLPTRPPHLPSGGRLPALRIRGLTVTLEREGRAPFTLEGASLTLSPQLEENLYGVLDDPVWGAFDITGRFAGGKLRLALVNDAVR